jgi:DNA-binding IclR family transcriptional regulator
VELKTDRLSGREIDDTESSLKAFRRASRPVKLYSFRDLGSGTGQFVGDAEMQKRMALTEASVLDLVPAVEGRKAVEAGPGDNLTGRARLSVLDRVETVGAGLADIVHPYLLEVFRESGLSSLLAVRRGMYAVVVDKVEDAGTIMSYRIGTRLPLLVGAPGKALLSQISRAEHAHILRKAAFLKSASNALYRMADVREADIRERDGKVIGYMEEHAGGAETLAVPLQARKLNLQAALLAFGLKRQWKDGRVLSVSKRLTEIAAEINCYA